MSSTDTGTFGTDMQKGSSSLTELQNELWGKKTNLDLINIQPAYLPWKWGTILVVEEISCQGWKAVRSLLRIRQHFGSGKMIAVKQEKYYAT